MKLLWDMYDEMMLLLMKMGWFGMGCVVMESAWRHFVASRDRNVELDSRKLRMRETWPFKLM